MWKYVPTVEYAWNFSIKITTQLRWVLRTRPLDETERLVWFQQSIMTFPYKLNIGWIRGHSDWEGNKYADLLTK